jgi:hypothetical protein
MLVGTLLIAMAVASEGSPLPQRLGVFVRSEVRPLTIAPGDRELYNEYRCETAYCADYTDGKGRRMTVDAFRFSDAEGAHAAFLCSRPVGGVSPMIWQINAVTGGGVTVMEYRNYLLRFYGALPSISSELAEMLAALPRLAADTAPRDLDGRYLDKLSTRTILGPVSLQRFAGRIPPSVAGFRLGAKGQMARFETPAGALTEVVLEYPTEEVARDRAKALGALPSAVVRVEGTCAGVTFQPVDSNAAEELLSGFSCGSVTVTWDPDTVWDGPMTLGEGIGGVTFWGLVFGAVIAGVRRFGRASDPYPNRMIFLRL